MSADGIIFRFPAQEALRWAKSVQERCGWFSEIEFLLQPGVGKATFETLKRLGFAIELGVETGRCALTPAGLALLHLV
jgi:hypothetical protein